MTVKWFGDEFRKRVLRGANRGIFAGTEAVAEQARQAILSPPKSGALYKRRGVVHQASAPGEAPASDTGRLVQSGRTEYNQQDISGRVIFSTEYALALEVGTVNMQPRPYLRPALEVKKDFIVEAVASRIQEELVK